ncbi:MAG: pyrroline-5-carboxylate reductase [Desulfohalobiaceae bacterium]|nr:pyrroline-5-carboxylate reductase [Desulfohalobiaceae bacterium]
MTRVGLVGLGHMGAALAQGWSRESEFELRGFDADAKRTEWLASQDVLGSTGSAEELVAESEYVVLAVKPQQIRELLEGIAPALGPGHCLVSIAAGVTMDSLTSWSGRACPVVRVMPNMPALVEAGVFAVCLEDSALTQAQQEFVRSLFQLLGRVHILPEHQFDAFTALVGSGPAYVYYLMESLIEAGVSLGFAREKSRDMVQGLLEGSVEMAGQSESSVTALRESIMSPAGTTGAGVLELERRTVRSAIVDAVMAACRRSSELGG